MRARWLHRLSRRLRRACAGAVAAVYALAILISPSVANPALGQTTISNLAYPELTSRTDANDASFFVYRNQDDALNHGFPSGLFGNISSVHIDTGCVFDAAGPHGCSTNPNVSDRSRGTVLRVTFDPQGSGTFAGVNLEEPENWGVLRLGAGYALADATSLTLDVYSPDGAMVQFSVGNDDKVANCRTPFTARLAAAWTTLTIPFNTSGCRPDLSKTNLLFGVATNDVRAPQGGTVLLDNIQFKPAPAAHKSTLGFPIATESFGVVPQQAAPIPLDQSLRNVTAIYESALTEFAFLDRGTPQDLADARLIADSFDYALHHDSHGDPIPVAPDGSTGLHNGYEGGDLALFNSQQPPKQSQAGDVRLAGFTATTLCPSSGFCLMMDGATGGNNAFAMLALVAAYREFSDVRYLNDARTIGHWALNNLKDSSGTGYGGYFLGYDDGGVPPPKPLVRGKSTENNADLFAAYTALASVESGLGNASAAAGWTSAANIAGDFVMQMFDPTAGRFNAGTVLPGSPPAPGNCPGGPQKGNDAINICDFLDADSFTTLALAGSSRYRAQIDWRRPVQHMVDTFQQTVTAGGRTYKGIDIVSTPISGANGISWEFTGQTVVVMRYVDQIYGDTRFESLADQLLGQIAQAQASAPFGDGSGVVASTLQGGDTLPLSQQCLNTPFQCIPERVGLAATTWAILAEQRANVLGAPLLTVAPPSVDAGGPVTVTWSSIMPPSARDWIGIYANDTNSANQFMAWEYVSCVQTPTSRIPSGSCTFNMPPTPGTTYEFRLFRNNSFDEIARSSTPVVVLPAVLSATTPVLPGGASTVTWAHVGSASPTDWIGVYEPGKPDMPPIDWEYVSCTRVPATSGAAAGNCPFVLPPTVSPDTYEFRMFSNNGFTRLATSNAVTIVVPHPVVTLQPARVAPGGRFNVQWSGWTPTSVKDWIGVYPAGGSNRTLSEWVYVSCTQSPAASTPGASGMCSLTAPTTIGNYDVGLFTNNLYVPVGTAGLTVAGPASLSVQPTSVLAGGSVTATWLGVVSPKPKDWIGLFPAGSANTAFIAWEYDSSCTRSASAAALASGTCTLGIPQDVVNGEYELRLFSDNGFSVLAASSRFSVGGGAAATHVDSLPAPALKPQTRSNLPAPATKEQP